MSNLDPGERFYIGVLGPFQLADFGAAWVLLYRPTSFVLALLRHGGALGDRFTELHIGLDHLGFSVSSRGELVAWEHRLEEFVVE